jgi:SAM-dependent methyltransferase
MEELVKRGYQYSGLDINRAMLEYSAEKARRAEVRVDLICADMNDFSLNREVDFVYIMLGSLSVRNTTELSRHFDCVAKALKHGGLYLLDWCVQFETLWTTEGSGTWVMERDGIKVKTTVSWKPINRVDQTFEETIIQEVDDHGKKLETIDKDVKRAIFPQEFLLFISSRSEFEFVGWWNKWDLDQPLDNADKIDRPIVLVRRK